jgi:hypothetical protein
MVGIGGAATKGTQSLQSDKKAVNAFNITFLSYRMGA